MMDLKLHGLDVTIMDGLELKEARRCAYDTLISDFLKKWPKSMVADNNDMGMLVFVRMGNGLYDCNPGTAVALPIGENLVAWDPMEGFWWTINEARSKDVVAVIRNLVAIWLAFEGRSTSMQRAERIAQFAV